MSEEKNIQTVEEFYKAAFSEEGVDTLVRLIREDVDLYLPGPEQLPWAGLWNNRNQAIAAFGKIMENIEIQKFEIEKVVAQNDIVFVVGADQGTIRKTGKVYQNNWVHEFTLHEGQIVKFRSFEDTYTIVQAITE